MTSDDTAPASAIESSPTSPGLPGWQRVVANWLGPRSDFQLVWAAQTISLLGTRVTGLALPLTAVLTLQAGPGEMGLLRAAADAPVLLLGLVAGVWVDRLRRRPILVATDLGRAFLLGSIPVAAVLGLLRLEYLWAVALLAGSLGVFSDIAVTSILPALVRREQLVAANSRLQLTGSVTAILGPGLAGWLVALVTAPLAIAVDALSYLMSAGLLLRAGPIEASSAAIRRSAWREIGDGARFLFGHPVLRPLTLSTAIGSLGGSIQATLLVLFATHELGIEPALLGGIVAAGGAAAVLSALAAGPLARRLGSGRAIVAGGLLLGLGHLIVPLVTGSPLLATPLLALAQMLSGGGMTLYSINQISLRQALTPDGLLGRVNACRRVLVFGVIPFGALTAGALGTAIGLRPTLLLGAAIVLLSFLVALWSPLRTMRPGAETES